MVYGANKTGNHSKINAENSNLIFDNFEERNVSDT
jgi:hypothetical protein